MQAVHSCHYETVKERSHSVSHTRPDLAQTRRTTSIATQSPIHTSNHDISTGSMSRPGLVGLTLITLVRSGLVPEHADGRGARRGVVPAGARRNIINAAAARGMTRSK